MKGLILFLFFMSFTVIFQNCSENPSDFQSTGLNVTCIPDGQCLRYTIHIDSTVDKKTAGVCIDTKATENGLTTEPKFSQGCTYYNQTCSNCNLNTAQQVSFSVAAKDSKAGVDQSISINFTADGKQQQIDY
jgi:hypothetical protein